MKMLLGGLIVAILGVFSPALISGPQISISELKSHFEQKRFTVVLVPGHDPVYSGTAFRDYTEAEVNLELSQYLEEYLKADGHFSVSITRDETGNYSDWLKKYIQNNREQILKFAIDKKQVMLDALGSGEATKVTNVEHNSAPSDTRLYLYGINKYGNDVNADLLLHVHFNDYPRPKNSTPGKYTGFVLYIPESQYGNASSTRVLAESLKKTLGEVIPGSNHPKEKNITVEDQDLIAVGVDNQRGGPSLLVEYSYIYEVPLRLPEIRETILREYAYQTYRGLRSYFAPDEAAPKTTLVPHLFTEEFSMGTTRYGDVLALQYMLKDSDAYPPRGKTFSECPLTGLFGDCTKAALREFQVANFGDSTGTVDARTIALLNTRYSK